MEMAYLRAEPLKKKASCRCSRGMAWYKEKKLIFYREINLNYALVSTECSCFSKCVKPYPSQERNAA